MVFAGIFLILALFVAVLLKISFDVYKANFINYRVAKDYSGRDENIIARTEYYKICEEKFMKLDYDDLSIRVDGFKLYGYYVSIGSDKTAILIHGWKDDCKKRMAASFEYMEKGYNVFLPDVRSHGRSDGKYIGMGIKEKKDIFRWIDYLRKKYGEDKIFVLDGESMGAATVLGLTGEPEAPSYFVAAVSDCAFTSAGEMQNSSRYKMSEYAKIVLSKFLEFWCVTLSGFSFYKNNPIVQVKKSRIPTFFIHGTEDTFVPFEMGEKLYDACSAEKEYLIVEGAAHAMSAWIAKEKYFNEIFKFLDKYTTGV